MTEAPNSLVVVGEGRILFPNLFEPKRVKKAGREVGEPNYSVLFLMEPDAEHMTTLKGVVRQVIEAQWPGRDAKELKLPFQRGEKLAEDAAAKGQDGDFYRGKVAIRARSKYAPEVVGRNYAPVTNASDVYSGCYGWLEVNVVAYDGVSGGQDGVKCYLNKVLKTRDGDRIGGRSAAAAFSGVVGGVSDEDPGLDDDIPF